MFGYVFERGFVGVVGDEALPAEILTVFVLHPGHQPAHLLIMPVEAIEPVENPSRARLEERDPKLRVTRQYAAANDVHRGHLLLERMADDVAEKEIAVRIAIRGDAGNGVDGEAAVHGNGKIQVLRGSPETVVSWVVQTPAVIRRRTNGRAAESQFGDMLEFAQ